jgi:hypothetical protein
MKRRLKQIETKRKQIKMKQIVKKKKPRLTANERASLVKYKALKSNKVTLVDALRKKLFNNPLIDERTTYSIELEFSSNKSASYFQNNYKNFAMSFTYDGSINNHTCNENCRECGCDSDMYAESVEARINCFNGKTHALETFLNETLKSDGIEVMQDNSCGTHISIKTIDSIDQATKTSRLTSAIELFYLISPTSRRGNTRYCNFKPFVNTKYFWLNTSNSGRIEARFPAASLNLKKIDNTAKLILFIAHSEMRFDSINSVKDIYARGMHNYNWMEFQTKLKKFIINSGMPSELCAFIEERLNKFKRREDKPIDLSFFYRGFDATTLVEGSSSCVA